MFWRWLFRSRGSRKVPHKLASPYRASAELLPGAPPRPPPPPPNPAPRDRMRAARGAPRAPMLAVFGLISVAARVASVHSEGSSSFRAFPPSEFPSPRTDAWRDVAGSRNVAKAYGIPGDVRVNIQNDRDAKPLPLWNAFRARAPLPSATAPVPAQIDLAR